MPLSVWGEVAVSEFAEPTMTVRVKGVVDETPPTASVKPDGCEAKLKTTVLGSSRSVAVELAPAASVAVASVPGTTDSHDRARRTSRWSPPASTACVGVAVRGAMLE